MTLSYQALTYLFLFSWSVLSAAEGHLIAFTPLLLADLGLDTSEVAVWSGLAYATMTAVAMPLAPFWGVIAERLSRKAVIVRSFYLLAAAMLVAAWAPNLEMVLFSRVLIGLSFSAMGVVIATQALLTPAHRLGWAIATVQAANPVANSLGPPIGSFAIQFVGLRGLFAIDAAVVTLVAIALTLLLPDPPQRTRRGSLAGQTGAALAFVWNTPPVRYNFLAALLFRGGGTVVESYLPVRITQVADDPAVAIGWVLGLFGLLSIAGNFVLSRFIDRADQPALFWRMMLFASLCTLGMTLAPNLWLLALCAITRAIPNSWANTLLHTHVAKVLPASQQTSVFTLAPAARNLGGLAFPLIASAIAIFGPAAALACAAAGYVGSSMMGLKMGAVSRGWKVPAEPREPQVAERPDSSDSASPAKRSEQPL